MTVRLQMVAVLMALAATGALAQPSELPATPPGPHVGLDAAAHEGAASATFGDPIVGTSYFYWYDIEVNGHIINHDGSDAMTTHPADMSDLSFKHASWHRTQMLDVMDAGIDFIMPVYWGVPGQYEGWSFAGLPPLVEAHDALIEEGVEPPHIGLFYDTSVLEWNEFNTDGTNYHVDLSTEFGRRWFYAAMRDFFSMIPPSKWARVDGKPIVFLYAGGFAKGQDPDQFTDVREWFRKDFGCEPFLVKMRDWQGDADAVYMWGGAVSMQLDEHVAALGPGYDHANVPGRTPLVVDRREGGKYIDEWQRLMRMNPDTRPWMVHVETWSEWHEGTDIADSREYGRQYIVLTRMFADMWRARQHLKPVGAYVTADSVAWREGKDKGIAPGVCDGDGIWELVEKAGKKGIVSRYSDRSPEARYLYFDVNDGFALTVEGETVKVTVTYLDKGCDGILVQYDNTNREIGSVSGAFREGGEVTLGGTDEWRTATFELPDVLFANRANGSDLRFQAVGGAMELTISEVVVVRAVGEGE
ncbi:MAG: DUF5010 domain-containing protein [bacterium]|nr:DUF5010 domain-containing protein [bacterium]